MNNYSETQTEVVLPSVWQHKYWPRSKLLVSSSDNVPISLNHPGVDTIVKFEIDTSTKSHRETGFIHMKIVEAKDRLQLWTVNIDLLDRNSKQRMSKRLEGWSIRSVVLELNSSEEVLQTRVDRSTSLRSGEIVFTKVK